MNKEKKDILEKSEVKVSKELEAFLAEKKRILENKKKAEAKARKTMKDNYYAYHSDIKTSARDNGEW